MTETQKIEATRAAAFDNWTNKFYETNKDLSEFKEVVNFVMEKEWGSVGNMEAEKAAVYLADKTRVLLKLRKEASLPQKELVNSPGQFTGASNGYTPQTPVSTGKNALDFISQVRNANKRGK